MIYVFLMAACLCSPYMFGMQNDKNKQDNIVTVNEKSKLLTNTNENPFSIVSFAQWYSERKSKERKLVGATGYRTYLYDMEPLYGTISIHENDCAIQISLPKK